MKKESVENLVIGAGLAGLACATRLHEANREVLMLEASDAVGGRVRTDRVDGFLLDRGFQVFLVAYPEATRVLNTEALGLKAFDPGALVWQKGELREVMDVFRRPSRLFATALSPVGSLRDKLLVGKLRARLLAKSCDEIWKSKSVPTSEYLRDFGFSAKFIDDFFRGFYGGIFLERELATSSRLFEFTFKMFSTGSAALPAEGMQAIPEEMASRLPENTIRLESPVRMVGEKSITTDDCTYEAKSIILAVDPSSAATLLGEIGEPDWNSTVCLYFSADEDPIGKPILALKGDRNGLVNHVCVPSSIAPSYAPDGKALVSISIVGDPEIDDLESIVRRELVDWFGKDAEDWTHLRTDRIHKALPAITRGHDQSAETVGNGVHLCGDYTTSASIDGAILSGMKVADKILG